ncbi:hypothetical protein ABZ883_14745 [Streptomyces sp. NPDC046977]|uniref:hypothetical protein n=1 Tax=Streptomyces sp. NPDC046977 TaxID=3154703 RepID=UPI0033D8D61F
MGWSSANSIFDPVAHALIDAKATPEAKRKVLGDLIKGLQEGDWDTEDESLELFLGDPAIVQAFADNEVHLSDRRCCRVLLADDPRAQLHAMRSTDATKSEMDRALDAYAHQLAELLRKDADLRQTEGEQDLARYGRELAHYIDPTVQKP